MYIKRLLEQTLKDAIKTFPAVFIGGPRRAGKTTLSKTFLKGYNYVLLDEADVRSLAIEDPRGFLEKYPPPVIIDEIQNAPGLLPYIKARIDENKKPDETLKAIKPTFNKIVNQLVIIKTVVRIYFGGIGQQSGV